MRDRKFGKTGGRSFMIIKGRITNGIDNIHPESHTFNMKTALSIPDDLFEEVRKIADKDKVSRSRIFADAIRGYLERRKNGQILVDLNEVYSQLESEEVKQVRKLGRRHYASKVIKDKW